MSQFSRRARWLNKIFPASTIPTVSDPGLRTDDVSLVQPYDGSGWGMTRVLQRSAIKTGTNTFHNAFTTGEDEIFRFLSADFVWLGTGDPATEAIVIMVDQGSLASLAIAQGIFSTSISPTQYAGLIPIVPPNTMVQFAMTGGNVITEVTWGWSGILAPVGTVFYV